MLFCNRFVERPSYMYYNVINTLTLHNVYLVSWAFSTNSMKPPVSVTLMA